MAWSLHDKTMDETSGNNRGEDMAQAVSSGPAQLGQSHVPQALGLQPAPKLLEGSRLGRRSALCGRERGYRDLELEAWGRVEKSYSLQVVLFCAGGQGVCGRGGPAIVVGRRCLKGLPFFLMPNLLSDSRLGQSRPPDIWWSGQNIRPIGYSG